MPLLLGSALVGIELDTTAPVWLWVLASYLYLTVVRRSVGSLGYLVMGLRIVDLKGQRPSLLQLSARLIWWCFGPLNALVDLVYLTGDEDCQAIRDKMFQTYVIKRSAQPAGMGPRRAIHMTFMTASLMVFEVARPPEQKPSVPTAVEEAP